MQSVNTTPISIGNNTFEVTNLIYTQIVWLPNATVVRWKDLHRSYDVFLSEDRYPIIHEEINLTLNALFYINPESPSYRNGIVFVVKQFEDLVKQHDSTLSCEPFGNSPRIIRLVHDLSISEHFRLYPTFLILNDGPPAAIVKRSKPIHPRTKITQIKERPARVCTVCGANSNRWHAMLHDELWESLGFTKRDLVCLECIEDKLGRSLTYDDYTNCIMNWGLMKEVERAFKAQNLTPPAFPSWYYEFEQKSLKLRQVALDAKMEKINDQ